MTRAEGESISRTMLDAIAMAEERIHGAELVACTVTLVVENDDVTGVVTASYPEAR